MAAGPLPVAEALSYAIALAEALREFHGRGRIYAFLQPATVAILDGQVRLASCGPAPISPYFSPEQVAGHDLDPRTDIFSLGAVMYEMLSGRRAFDAPTRTALRMEILDRKPPGLENVPPVLARLVRRCLEKKPERRIQRMEILLAELKLQAIFARPADSMRLGPKPVTPRIQPHR
jgi:serine/threonine protein kinase